MPRRTSIALLASGLALMLAPAAHAMDARPAAAFADSVGVNVHMSYVNTPYGDVGRVRDALTGLGVTHVRDGVCGTCTWERDAQAEVAAAGIDFTQIIGATGPGGLDEAKADLEEVAAHRRSYTAALEDLNEPDNAWGDADWAAHTRQQAELTAGAVRTDPRLAGLPVIAPSLVTVAGREALGDLSPLVSYGNSHAYRMGQAPEHDLDTEDALAAQVAPGKPVIATEAGYRSEGDPSHWSGPVSEDTAARYLSRMFLEHFRRGWKRTFDYELIDSFPAGTTGAAADQTGYGLLRYDGTERPAYTALQQLMALVGDAPATTGTAGALDVSLHGGPADVRQVLLERADGSYVLALWRPTSDWDVARHTALADPDAAVTVDLPAKMAVTGHRLAPDASSWGLGTTAQVTVPVSGAVTLLELKPVAQASAAAQTPAAQAPVAQPPVAQTPVAPVATTAAAPAVTAAAPVTTPATPVAATTADAPAAVAPAADAPAAVAPAATVAAAATVHAVAPTATAATIVATPAIASPLTVRAVLRGGFLKAAAALPTGAKATRIAYLIDGRTVARRTGAPWSAKLPLQRIAPGRHALHAIVRLSSGTLVRTPAVSVLVRR